MTKCDVITSYEKFYPEAYLHQLSQYQQHLKVFVPVTKVLFL